MIDDCKILCFSVFYVVLSSVASGAGWRLRRVARRPVLKVLTVKGV